MRFSATPIASFIALIAAVPALAGELAAPSKIDAVTVYPDAASVTRIADIDLPAGSTTLVFKGLPIGIDTASLRVEGTADQTLVIGSVESRIAPAERPNSDELAARIKTLREQREVVQVTIDSLEGKRAMIQHFAQANPEKVSLDGKPLELGQWDAAWDKVAAALAKVGDGLRDAHAKARDLDAEIKGLEESRQRPATMTGPARDVTVALDADGATKAKVKLTYRIAGAAWQPSYDARLTTNTASKQPTIELVRRAAITQRTGEDWNDVALIVSTVSTARGTAAPDIQPRRIAFAEFYEEGLAGAAKARRAGRPAGAPALMEKPAESEAVPTTAPPPAPIPKPIAERQSTLDSTAYEASFVVPGRITIPADGAEKSFRLDSRSVTPDLQVKSVPALDTAAYLEAHLVNEGDAPLLPGDVHLVRDGTFVGTGDIAAVAPGDGFDLGFGADDRVKITRVPVKRRENDPFWIGNNKTESDEFKTTVKNLHDFPIKVQVLDQIPFSETSTIVVEQTANTTPPTDKTIGDKRGVMGWTFDLAPNAVKEIHLAYRMKWPAGRDILYETVPVQPH